MIERRIEAAKFPTVKSLDWMSAAGTAFHGSSLTSETVMTGTRTETDTFGPIEVPADRYWGAQAERARRNFASARNGCR